MSVQETLTQRGTTYGLFADHAAISQALKAVMHRTPGWSDLAPDQREALEMVQHKIARILNGNPDYVENFRDIAGYSTLVAERLLETDGAADAQVTQMVRVKGVWVES